jgi:hypothetical protein
MPNRALPPAPRRPDGPKIPGPTGPKASVVSRAPVARPPAPPVYRPHSALAQPKAPPIYRPAAAPHAVSPKMIARQAAPPVYRPAKGPVQMTPTTWRSAVEVATVEGLASGWTFTSKWPAVKGAVAAYGQLRDGDLVGRRRVLGQLATAIDNWKKNQATNNWQSVLDLSKQNAVQALELLIQQELAEINAARIPQILPTPSSQSLGLGLGSPGLRGFGLDSNSNTTTTTVSYRNDTPPLRSQPIGVGYSSASNWPTLNVSYSSSSTPSSSPTRSGGLFHFDEENEDKGSPEFRSSPPIASAAAPGSSIPSSGLSFRPTTSSHEDFDNQQMISLRLRTYLHFTKEDYLQSIGNLGLIAGKSKGIGLPETGESDPVNVYVVSGSPGATFASGEAGGHPVAVITSESPDRDVNYKGGAYTFYKAIPPLHSFVSDGTSFSFNLPPDGPTKSALAAFVNRRRFGLTPLSVEEAWQMVRADLLVRFRLHLSGLI